MLRKHLRKIGASADKVEAVYDGLYDNMLNYLLQMRHLHTNGFFLYLPHMKSFFYAIPGKAYHKLAVNTLRTYINQAQDHCGKTLLTNSENWRERAREREREREPLHKRCFGRNLDPKYAT